jgi:CIC family chloride channel protein
MNSEDVEKQHAELVALAIVSLIAGAACGALGTLFRLSLGRADQARDVFIAWARSGHAVVGFVLVLLAASASTALAAWLVRRFAPEASGSGIPHVESVLNGDQPAAPLALIPVKFVGGVLAIGAGLALGREGPTVQMGASIAHLLGTLFRRNADDCRVLLAAGAGAGLATAFNAPIAGAVFVLEELVRRFETRTTIAALGASAGAIAVARLMHGDSPDFQFAAQPFPGFGTVPAHLALGVVVGLLGAAYCRAILLARGACRRSGRTARVACTGPGGRRRRGHTARPRGHRRAFRHRAHAPDPLRAGCRVICSAYPGRTVCADARARRTNGPRVRPDLHALVPRGGR